MEDELYSQQPQAEKLMENEEEKKESRTSIAHSTQNATELLPADYFTEDECIVNPAYQDSVFLIAQEEYISHDKIVRALQFSDDTFEYHANLEEKLEYMDFRRAYFELQSLEEDDDPPDFEEWLNNKAGYSNSIDDWAQNEMSNNNGFREYWEFRQANPWFIHINSSN
jgi:hypothetical protein